MSGHDGRFYELGDRKTPRMFAPSLWQAVADNAEGVDLRLLLGSEIEPDVRVGV